MVARNASPRYVRVYALKSIGATKSFRHWHNGNAPTPTRRGKMMPTDAQIRGVSGPECRPGWCQLLTKDEEIPRLRAALAEAHKRVSEYRDESLALRKMYGPCIELKAALAEVERGDKTNVEG